MVCAHSFNHKNQMPVFHESLLNLFSGFVCLVHIFTSSMKALLPPTSDPYLNIGSFHIKKQQFLDKIGRDYLWFWSKWKLKLTTYKLQKEISPFFLATFMALFRVPIIDLDINHRTQFKSKILNQIIDLGTNHAFW